MTRTALGAYPVEQLAARGQLGHDVVFVLSWSVLASCLRRKDAHPRLEPVVELDNVRVVHALKHLQLVVDHLLVPAHVLLQDDLDGDLALGAVGLSDNAIGTGTERLSEAVSRSGGQWLVCSCVRGKRGVRTCGRSCQAGRAACSAY